MDSGLFFTERFDLSKPTSRFAAKNSAHAVGGQFRSFWVSAVSPNFRGAKIYFNNHKGSDSGEAVSLRLNMSAKLPYMIETACIEVPFAQLDQWIEITFSTAENFDVGSVAVQLENAPPMVPVVDFGGISLSNDDRLIFFDIYTNETISNGGTVPVVIQGCNRKIKDNVTGKYIVPEGYIFRPLAVKTLYYAKPANSLLFLRCSTNEIFDSTGMFGSFNVVLSGDLISYSTAITSASPKQNTSIFAIEDAYSNSIEKTYFNEGEKISFKFYSSSAAAASYNVQATVIGLLERKTF